MAGPVDVVGFELVVVVGFRRVVVVGFGLAVVDVVSATPGPAAAAWVVVAVEAGGESAAEGDTVLFAGVAPTDTVVTRSSSGQVSALPIAAAAARATTTILVPLLTPVPPAFRAPRLMEVRLLS